MTIQISTRYKSLISRSFKSKLDLFLFHELKSGKRIDEIEDKYFVEYAIDDAMVGEYEKAWHLKAEETIGSFTIKDFDREIDKWYTSRTDLKGKLLLAYELRFAEQLRPEDFATKCKDEKCNYCDITEESIALLKINGLIKTKRGRGTYMEIDRLNSNKEYTSDNIVLACYWCNNAKTDEFTYEEFKQHVAPGIKAVWQARLSG